MDLVERLRTLADSYPMRLRRDATQLLSEAADALERLQARVAKLEEERDGKIALDPATSRGGIRA